MLQKKLTEIRSAFFDDLLLSTDLQQLLFELFLDFAQLNLRLSALLSALVLNLDNFVQRRNQRLVGSLGRLNIDDAAAMAKYVQAQGELSSALSRLMAISENYPDLKANQNFLDLQTQLEGTENRIAVERRKYNESARDFNTYIKMFPRNLLSGMFGFAPMGYFEAQEGAQNAPAVSFE